MENISKLILCVIPNQKCNLKCEYCYISQLEAWDEPEKFKFSPKHIAKCFSKDRLGGTSLINLTGNGETLLQPEVIELTRRLLEEGHFVEIVTNGTVTKRINELLELPSDLLTRLFFKISFHYKELNRLLMMDKFFDNVRAIHMAGASFTLELMAYDGIENDIKDIIRICKENVGAVCHSTIGRNEHKDAGLLSVHSKEVYARIWDELDSPMERFKLEMIGIKRREFCYAGAWSLFVNLYTGEAQPCYWQPYNQNIFENPKNTIKFEPVGHTCSQPFCINAHAHLTWGLIPELSTPTYASMRNRVMDNKEEWLTKECKDFFNTRLYNSNKQYSNIEKIMYSLSYPFRMGYWFLSNGKNNFARLKKHAKRKILWKAKKWIRTTKKINTKH